MTDTRSATATGRLGVHETPVRAIPGDPGPGGAGRRAPLRVGEHVLLGGGDLVFLGMTGDGRYAFVGADGCGSADRSVARLNIRGRIGTEMALGCVRPGKRLGVDRDSGTRVS